MKISLITVDESIKLCLSAASIAQMPQMPPPSLNRRKCGFASDIYGLYLLDNLIVSVRPFWWLELVQNVQGNVAIKA